MQQSIRSVLAAASACVFCVAAPAVRADEYVDQANKLYADISPSKRSDTVILPLLAKISEPPSSVSSFEKSVLLLPGMSGFDTAAAWAAEPSQQELIAALKKVTGGNDYRESFAFALPYGADGVSPELVRAGMYIELGDPPTLAGAQVLFLPLLDRFTILVNVEASRLLGEGKAQEAVDVLLNWCIFCRQIADRQFFREATWGLKHTAYGFERLRDVVYQDAQGGKKIPVEWFVKSVKRIEDPRGLIAVDRMKFPHADYYAAKQLVARCFPPRGKPDPEIFATTMARIGSTDHPLKLFSESARWRSAAAEHADEIDTTKQLEQTFGDFRSRWEISYFDRRMGNPTAYSGLSSKTYALITNSIPDLTPLTDMRQIVRTEIAGTSNALAIVAYWYSAKSFPATMSSIRPAYIEKLPADPFNPPNQKLGLYPNFEFFVPIRDTRDRFGPREEPKPHRMNVVVLGSTAFDIPLGNDQFVLYSVGSDNAKNWADRVQNVARGREGRPVQGADFLIWPPVASLYRKHLQDAGQLK